MLLVLAHSHLGESGSRACSPKKFGILNTLGVPPPPPPPNVQPPFK